MSEEEASSPEMEVEEEVPSSLMGGPADDDTLRIMISTDNHLGYNEGDPVRGLDSFAAFEEVLYLSKRYQCDMVLLSGDLFHANRPSRHTLHKTMDILRRYVFGPNPVKIQILSDPTTTLSRSQSIVNYLSEYHSVDLPIFSIHGNHDDPSRDTQGELLAALDLLSVTSLVNYFGRQDAVEQVCVKPILLSKGSTQVALYGLGALREERLNRMFQKKLVKFQRPEEDEDDENANEFLNIFCLHQNREMGRGAKNCVKENMIPEWFDIVIWGHEHEQNIEPMESVVGTFRISQPGSSVATSLVSGEAVRKKIGILDVKGNNFRMEAVPLTQVRSFVTTEIALKESREELDPDDPRIEEKVSKVLEEEVRLMILNARDKMKQVHKEALKAENHAGDEDSPLQYKLVNPEKVLVRVRVEHSGFTTLNPQRFGNKFVGDVANPHELLLFHRRKEPAAHPKSSKKRGLKTSIAPDEFDDKDSGKARLEHLLQELLDQDQQQLKLLEKNEMREGLEEYAEKGGNQTIIEVIDGCLETKQDVLISGQGKTQDGDTVDKPSQVMNFFDESQKQEEEAAKKPAARKKGSKRSKPQADDDDDDFGSDTGGKENLMDLDESSVEEAPKRSVARKSSSKVARTAPKDPKRMAARRHRLNDVADNSSDEEAPKAKKSRSKSASRPKRNASRSVNYSVDDDGDDDSDPEVVDLSQEDDDVLEVDEPVKKAKTYTKKSTAAKSSKKKAAKASRKTFRDDSDDESDGDFGTGPSNFDKDDWGSAATRSQL